MSNRYYTCHMFSFMQDSCLEIYLKIIFIFINVTPYVQYTPLATRTFVFTKLDSSNFQLIFKRFLCIAAFTVERTVIAYWNSQVTPPREDVCHYCFTCPNYTEIRLAMMSNLNWTQTIDMNLLTCGSDDLTYEDTINILKQVFHFIKSSGRSLVVWLYDKYRYHPTSHPSNTTFSFTR